MALSSPTCIFAPFWIEMALLLKFSEAKLPQQNARAECNDRNILRKARILLAASGLKPGWWSYAVRSTTFTLKRIYCKWIEDIPFYRFYRRNPNIKLLKVFGAQGYALDRSSKTKPNLRSVPIIFLGYADERKSYVVLYTTTNHVGYCRTLQLDEEEAIISVEKRDIYWTKSISSCQPETQKKMQDTISGQHTQLFTV